MEYDGFGGCYEPGSGWNLPPGCYESDPRAPWNQEEPRVCGTCTHFRMRCRESGICDLDFREAFAESGAQTPWEVARWARDWAIDNDKDMQEDGCDRWVG